MRIFRRLINGEYFSHMLNVVFGIYDTRLYATMAFDFWRLVPKLSIAAYLEDNAMTEEEALGGGAGAALAAHSKDGSATGATPASKASGNKWESNDMSETVTRLAEQAQDGIERSAKVARDAAGSAADTLSKQGGRAVDDATHFVRDQPLLAMVATGIVGLILGALLARR